MAQFFIYVRRHWQALLVSIFFLRCLWRCDFESNLAMWIAVGLAVVGMVMNLAVILINRGMPAAVTSKEIADDERPHYLQSVSQLVLQFCQIGFSSGICLSAPVTSCCSSP